MIEVVGGKRGVAESLAGDSSERRDRRKGEGPADPWTEEQEMLGLTLAGLCRGSTEPRATGPTVGRSAKQISSLEPETVSCHAA